MYHVQGRGEVCTEFWWGNRRERGYSGVSGAVGAVLLEMIFKNWNVGVRTELGWLRIGYVAGACECGEEPSGSIKRGEFLDYLQTS
jgi:hypothetical protein